MYYTFESNKIYPVIKAGKKYFKKVDHFAPVSPKFFFFCFSVDSYTSAEHTVRIIRSGGVIDIVSGV